MSLGLRPIPPYQVASWSIQAFGHNRYGPKIGGSLFWGGELGPHLTQCRLGWGLPPYKMATTDMGWKLGAPPRFGGEGAGSPSNTMWPGPRPMCVPNFIFIHPTVWLQSTDRQDNGPMACRAKRFTYKRSPKIRVTVGLFTVIAFLYCNRRNVCLC